MARGLPPNKHFKVHLARNRGSFIGAFSKGYSKALVVEIIEPATSAPLMLIMDKATVRFYYKDNFESHFDIIETFQIGTSSLQYLEIWRHCLTSLGSEFTAMQTLVNGAKKLRKWDFGSSSVFAHVAAIACRNAGVKCPENLSQFRFKQFRQLLQTCSGRGAVRSQSA